MNTAERLLEYYPFDDDIVASVADAAAGQNQRHFSELATHYNLAERLQNVPALHYANRSFELLHMTPTGDYDETKARVLVAPFAMPVNDAMAMRVLRLFAADPSEQLLVIGAPAPIGNRHNRPQPGALRTVWRGDLKPLVMPLIMHIRHGNNDALHRVAALDTLGFSYGADAAMAVSVAAAERGIAAECGVWVEPGSARRRTVRKLRNDAKVLGEYRLHFDRYVQDADSMPLREALCGSEVSELRYAGGLMRLSNLAILRALSRGDFADRAAQVLHGNPRARATIAWGTKSEFVSEQAMQWLVARLGNRVGALALTGMHHAGGNDIDLHAAIMLQGLRNANRE